MESSTNRFLALTTRVYRNPRGTTESRTTRDPLLRILSKATFRIFYY